MSILRNNSRFGVDLEWFWIKFSLILLTFPVVTVMIFQGTECPYPTGVCKLYDFSPFFSPIGRLALLVFYALACLLYLMERKMLGVLSLLFLLSNIIISHHESNGFFFRATVLTTVWGAQLFAYLRYKVRPDFNLGFYRINYPIQIIGATYTLAGIAKLRASGIGWFTDSSFFPVQIVKNFAFEYFDTGNSEILKNGKALAFFFIDHPQIISTLLLISLILELFCLIASLGPRVRMVWGVGLLLMHIGIAAFMGIGISVIANPMIVFFLNPLYRIEQIIRLIFKKLSPSIRSTA